MKGMQGWEYAEVFLTQQICEDTCDSIMVSTIAAEAVATNLIPRPLHPNVRM